MMIYTKALYSVNVIIKSERAILCGWITIKRYREENEEKC